MNPRVVHSRPRPRLIRDQSTCVVASRRNERPAIVVTGQEDVHFIAAHWTDFRLPQLAGLGMKRESVSVSMTVSEDLGFCTGAADKGIIGRHGAVITQPQGLPDMIAEVLRLEAKTV